MKQFEIKVFCLIGIILVGLQPIISADSLHPTKEKLDELALKGAAIIQKSLSSQSIVDVPKKIETNSTIGVVTLSTPNRTEFSSITLGSVRSYCKKMGYNYHEYGDSFDTSRTAPWSKIRALQDVMQKNPSYSWIVWIDDDILITNPFIKLEDFIENYGNDKDFIVSQDADADKGATINTGIFFIRNNNKMSCFLDEVWQKGKFKIYPFHEQCAIAECIKEKSEYSDSTEILPLQILQGFLHPRLLQTPSGWIAHVFSAHAAGMDHGARVRIFTAMESQGILPQRT